VGATLEARGLKWSPVCRPGTRVEEHYNGIEVGEIDLHQLLVLENKAEIQRSSSRCLTLFAVFFALRS
jgi:hypothetical protein